MSIYVYETVPEQPKGNVQQFELQQSMKDESLTRDPETKVPVRLVISGSYGFTGTESAQLQQNCNDDCDCQ